jgi:hypothetical protein
MRLNLRLGQPTLPWPLVAEEERDSLRGVAQVLQRLATRDPTVRPTGRQTTAPPALAAAGDEGFGYSLSGILSACFDR